MTNGKCGTCGSELVAWAEKYAEGFTVCRKCENCQKVWRFDYDNQGNWVGGSIEDRNN